MYTAHVDNLLHGLSREGLAPASVNKVRAVLHAVFSRARRAGKWVGENPVAPIPPFPVPKRAYITLSVEENMALDTWEEGNLDEAMAGVRHFLEHVGSANPSHVSQATEFLT